MVLITALGNVCIDRYEASIGADGAAESAAGITPSGYSWDEANAACTAAGKRLCEEDEWFEACQGPDEHTYPYGDAFDPHRCNGSEHGEGARVPNGSMVGCEGGYPGIFDMSGNAWEWTTTCAGGRCRLRGGCYYSHPDFRNWSCSATYDYSTGTHNDYVGFRCCLSLRSCVPGCDGGDCGPGEWAVICAGSFTMGSPAAEVGRAADEGQHEVTLTRDFLMLSTEVTQSEFNTVMGYNPSSHAACGDCPVEMVTWSEAAAYCNELSDTEALDRCYSCTGTGTSVACTLSDDFETLYECPGYRIPTEAEWEYAARSGTVEARYGETDDVAWCFGISGGVTHDVGTRDASPWGLYDMLGNIWEWVHDWYGAYPVGPIEDPLGPAAGSERVWRGGSYYGDCRYSRAAARISRGPTHRGFDLGFRPVRTLGLE